MTASQVRKEAFTHGASSGEWPRTDNFGNAGVLGLAAEYQHALLHSIYNLCDIGKWKTLRS